MLFDPFEEQFDLPTALVELSDRQRRKDEVVRQEDESLVVVGVEVTDSSQGIGKQLRRLDTGEKDRLIAAQPERLVDRVRLAPSVVEVALGPSDEERRLLMESVQASEVGVGLVHDVESARLDRQFVQDIHIVQFSVRNPDKTGDIAPQG